MTKINRDKIYKKYTPENTLIGNLLCSILYHIGEMLIDDKIKNFIKESKVKGTILKMKGAISRKIRPILTLSVKKKSRNLDGECKKLILDAPLED